MRIRLIGSGSTGNAMLVRAGGRAVLFDAGVPVSRIEAGCRAEGLEPGQLDAVFVSHEHGDHAGGAPLLSKRHRLGVICSEAVRDGLDRSRRPLPVAEPLQSETDLGGMRVHSFTVPHDAPNVGFRIEAEGLRVGVATDLGRATPEAIEGLRDCDVLMLESNYDEDLLASGPYPRWLQERIAGRDGHLSNGDSAALAGRCVTSRTRALVLLHLSEKTNNPAKAVSVHLKSLADAGRNGLTVTAARRHGTSSPLEF